MNQQQLKEFHAAAAALRKARRAELRAAANAKSNPKCWVRAFNKLLAAEARYKASKANTRRST